ncbi:MAG: signal peptidase I [Anaerolineales bacterium]|nr:signal peptidase I [Anaerolineales bacterium]
MEIYPHNEPAQVEAQPATEEELNWKRFILDLVQTLGLAIVLFVGINFISARVRVDGTSMVPTLQDGEFVFVSKLSYRWSEITRGDIIVFHFPRNPEEDLIKRVIGLPGDRVEIRNGQVFVNGQPLNEPYIAEAPNYAAEWQVEPQTLFVLGDNRNNSSDSHSWGLLPIEKIVGKAIFIYWPPKFWKMIQHTNVFAAP